MKRLTKIGSWSGEYGPTWMNENFIILGSRRRVGEGHRRRYVNHYRVLKRNDPIPKTEHGHTVYLYDGTNFQKALDTIEKLSSGEPNQ